MGPLRRWRVGLDHFSVTFGAGSQLGDLAVGAALGTFRHGARSGEAEVGLADAEGFGGFMAAFV